MIAVFLLINIFQPLHKPSSAIHQVIFNLSLFFFVFFFPFSLSYKMVLGTKSLWLCERGLGVRSPAGDTATARGDAVTHALSRK